MLPSWLRGGVSSSRGRFALVRALRSGIVPWFDDCFAIFSNTLQLGDTTPRAIQLGVAKLDVLNGFGVVVEHGIEGQRSAFEFAYDLFEFDHGPFKRHGGFVSVGLRFCHDG